MLTFITSSSDCFDDVRPEEVSAGSMTAISDLSANRSNMLNEVGKYARRGLRGLCLVGAEAILLLLMQPRLWREVPFSRAEKERVAQIANLNSPPPLTWVVRDSARNISGIWTKNEQTFWLDMQPPYPYNDFEKRMRDIAGRIRRQLGGSLKFTVETALDSANVIGAVMKVQRGAAPLKRLLAGTKPLKKHEF